MPALVTGASGFVGGRLLGALGREGDVRALLRRTGAKQVVLQYPGLAVRVAMHVAVMQRHGIEQVLSFDAGFERVPRIVRVR